MSALGWITGFLGIALLLVGGIMLAILLGIKPQYMPSWDQEDLIGTCTTTADNPEPYTRLFEGARYGIVEDESTVVLIPINYWIVDAVGPNGEQLFGRMAVWTPIVDHIEINLQLPNVYNAESVSVRDSGKWDGSPRECLFGRAASVISNDTNEITNAKDLQAHVVDTTWDPAYFPNSPASHAGIGLVAAAALCFMISLADMLGAQRCFNRRYRARNIALFDNHDFAYNYERELVEPQPFMWEPKSHAQQPKRIQDMVMAMYMLREREVSPFYRLPKDVLNLILAMATAQPGDDVKLYSLRASSLQQPGTKTLKQQALEPQDEKVAISISSSGSYSSSSSGPV